MFLFSDHLLGALGWREVAQIIHFWILLFLFSKIPMTFFFFFLDKINMSYLLKTKQGSSEIDLV